MGVNASRLSVRLMSGAAGDNVYIKYHTDIYINADASTYNTLLDVDSVNFCLGEVGADYYHCTTSLPRGGGPHIRGTRVLFSPGSRGWG